MDLEFERQIVEGYREVAKRLIDENLVEIIGKPFSQKEQIPKKEFGAKLRSMREEKGVPIAALARNIKRDPGMISKIETGKYPVPCQYLYQISEVFDVPIYNLLVEAGYLRPKIQKILEQKSAFDLRLFEEAVNTRAVRFNF